MKIYFIVACLNSTSVKAKTSYRIIDCVLFLWFILRNVPGAIEILWGGSIDANNCAPARKYI